MQAEAPSQAPVPASPPLDRSLFSRDLTGSVTESDLQRILQSQLDVEFPFRLGVVALDQPFRAEAEAPVAEQGIAATVMADAIKGSSRFSHVTNVSTALPNPQGLEGLRTIAARYRLRYLLICSSRLEGRTHLNNWAWLYPTVVGIVLAPGVTVGSQGIVEASLLDVKTGTVLFTATEPFETSSVAWVIGAARKHARDDSQAIAEATERLARQVLSQTEELAVWLQQQEPRDQLPAAGPITASRAE